MALQVLDAAKVQLCERIVDLPMKLRQVALRLRYRADVREEVRLASLMTRKIMADRETQRSAALQKLAAFEDMAAKLRRAQQLRELAAAMEAANRATAGAVAEELQWLRDAADWLDPTVRRRSIEFDSGPAPRIFE